MAGAGARPAASAQRSHQVAGSQETLPPRPVGRQARANRQGAGGGVGAGAAGVAQGAAGGVGGGAALAAGGDAGVGAGGVATGVGGGVLSGGGPARVDVAAARPVPQFAQNLFPFALEVPQVGQITAI